MDRYATYNRRYDERAAQLAAAGWHANGTEYGVMWCKGNHVRSFCIPAAAMLYTNEIEWSDLLRCHNL